MKLYVVTANTYTGGWGANIHLLLVTDNEEAAKKKREWAEKQGFAAETVETDLNAETDKYLGGYIE